MSGAAHRRGPGRALRALTGADESILDAVPSERSRYTAMGGVVLGTALMAMFSMTVALICVFDGYHPSILLFVPVWGAFILCLDRWLMSSGAASHTLARFWKMVPRLLLAVVFGVIIAEPLLLGVFNAAIEKRIKDDRLASVAQYESDLKQCNPIPGSPEDAPNATAKNDPKCEKLRFAVKSDTRATEREIEATQAEINTLKADLDADDKEYAKMEDLARRECNGTPGAGLTGRSGEGPNCRRLRGKADEFRRDQRMDANQAKLKQLNEKVTLLNTQLGGKRTDAGGQINQTIAERVADFKGNQREIGLLERLGALGDLVEENGHMRAAEWALRLFFVGVDSLPVLLKFLNGYSNYDRVVADRTAGRRRAERVSTETERRRRVIQEELARIQMNAEHASAVNKVEFDARMRHVDVEVLRENLTDSRAEYLLHDSPTLPLTVPPPAGLPHDSGSGDGRYR
ncbi:DUF4407 domain-containing protein [Phytohabitans suffuscus]|uniref:DUF4407 domain-containing protein n=1 Tax=Phytohabitans suffuscus TaxID=624315 RepID=A0A6F8YF87_9ACTN|nr:DUF4407 domain-containing protein [Phytohabitans suffuscus]BCB84730.1 hypothetical protein Psuf_020430 [Phytohabitans suffuscus]